ncbi:MAG: ABC transporter permease [Chloroflexota bacterium]|nr:ABC transporter permease [Chloroflexota bacterium]
MSTMIDRVGPGSPLRRLAAALYRRPRVQLGLLLSAPIGWLVVAYLGSLLILFINSFWRLDPFTGTVVYEPGLQNFERLVSTEVYRTITVRTLGIAAAVTLTDALIAFPIAYYMARVASPRVRGWLVVAILMPLWSSYLVKVFAWRIILQDAGPLNAVLRPLGLEGPGFTEGEIRLWLCFSYLWLPYMILPIFAGLERIPNSLLEASGDLGARGWSTFRRVVLPLAFPAVVAGSIFTFSLTMGDYIAPNQLSSVQFIGNVVQSNVGVAGNLPFAAAFALVPVVVMLAYLAVARRLGAFDSL